MVNLVAIKNLAMSRKILLEKWNKVSKIKFKILLSFLKMIIVWLTL